MLFLTLMSHYGLIVLAKIGGFMHLSSRGLFAALSIFVILLGCSSAANRGGYENRPYVPELYYSPPAPITTEVTEVAWQREHQYPWAGYVEVWERAKIRCLNR